MAAGTIQERVLKASAGCAIAIVLTLAAFRLHLNLSAATSLHLFLIAAIALRWGLFEATVVSMLSVLCLDYFFTDPLFVLYITDSRDWIAMVTFEAAALLVSTLSNQTNRHAREAEVHRDQLQKLYELSQQILLLDRDAAVEQRLTSVILSTLQIQGITLWNAYDLHLSRSGNCTLSDDEVRSVFHLNITQDDPEAAMSRRVLRAGTRPIGALILCGHTLDSATVNAVAALVAVAMERARSFSTESDAKAAKQSEQLRSAILDGLAHAFKSPLTTILTSSSGLLAMDTLSGTEQRLVTMIDHQASRMNDLATHLLSTARLDGGDLKLKRESIDVNEVVRQTADASSPEIAGHAIDVLVSAQPRLVKADRKLIQMALLQLLDNACKYGLPGSSVAVQVSEEQSEFLISVTNQGSFIPADEREKVFQRFYRCAESARAVSGTGIGLSVVRRITEAHHGRAFVSSDRTTGTTFTITLPRTAGGE
ncbi:two-component system sensor histidine kinase KdpD [Granulicella aggregans]|uniref:histidine kinase n=1 Tax=Granulicella aggregans TaxID=474949 RepID=A0A7W7ZB06_9BACT|nr:ATP-binding protein [Granulicella aggregans]MBB5056457.1 two-component system sensor histidine kinase KdpD [Granulicella aggregans]